jgi:hypothetical protein
MCAPPAARSQSLPRCAKVKPVDPAKPIPELPAETCTETCEPIEEAAADPCDDGDAMVRLLAKCAPPAPAAADAMERRLARIEAALGVAEQAKRTPTHAAAIRRAWFFRRAMRNNRSWALSEVAQKKCAQDKAAALQGQLNSDCKRVDGLEAAFADERAELVGEIDRLRTASASQDRLGNRLARVRSRAIHLRRDVARTRAERDGIAANLQAMSRRVAADAALIDRLQPAADATRPRIILNAR